MANSRSSSRCSSVASYGQRPPSLSDPPPPPAMMGIDPNDGRGDEIQPCPVGFHPMAHTPPPQHQQQSIYATQEQLREEHRQQQMLPPKPVKERRLPSRSGSTASLFSPFASLTRRLGAKHKSSKTSASSSRSTGHGSRMSTPVEFPAQQQQHQGPMLSRSNTPASVYSTFPRIHSSSSSNTPSPSGRTPFISQLLGLNSNGNAVGGCGGGGGGSSSSSSATVPATTSCPSCPSPGPSYSSSSRLSSAGGYPPMMMTEVLDEPVEEEGAGERVTWEYHHVTMNRVPGYGFGIAVSGGRDNPHFANGDPSIAISDVIKGGPAEGKLLINDRVMSVNGVSLENVDYGTAVSVLRDSGAAVNLVVKRRIVLGAYPEPTTYKVTLTKSKKKDDFGVILGSRIYLKELTNRALIDRDGSHGNNSPVFQEGDIVLKINSTSTDGLSLKEAKKLMENCKDKLQLTVRRDAAAPALLGAVGGSGPVGGSQASNGYNDPTYGAVKDGSAVGVGGVAGGGGGGGGPHFANYADRPNYCNQNLYVQPPTRGGSVDYRNPLTPQPPLPHSAGLGPYNNNEDKSNLSRLAGRSRGPLMDVSLSQLDHHNNHMNGHAADGEDAPPRPPPPRSDDYYSPRRANEAPEPVKPPPTLDPRFISFQKEGSVGIRVTGGNQVGIFVTAVQPGSPAALQGLVPGDKILKVNDMEMNGVTREEAVLFLLSLQDQIELVVQHKREEYDQVVASGHGDSFYVKTHFNYEQPASGHMAFRKGEVFHVVDTLYKGVVGAWQAFRVGPNGQDLQQGVVPNSAGAEELATAQFNAAKKEAATTTSESRGSFFRRRRPTHRRSKSLGRDHWDDVVFAETLSKFPAYERVVLRHPGFIRPVVFFGPIADVARDKLIKDFPDKFSAPQMDGNRDSTEVSGTGAPVATGRSGIVRLSAIRELVEKGRHALLDITPGAVDKLNYAQFYPVVIFLRADSKHTVKELRAGIPKTAHKSSKKLYEQCVKLEKLWSHVFTTTVPLTQRDTWYRKLREAIDREQNQAIWVSEAKLDEYLSDDFLFPMTSRLSYASSPESDLDLSPEPRASGSGAEGSSKTNGINGGGGGGKSPPSPSGRLVKSCSDPSIATQDDLGVSGMSSPGVLLKSLSPNKFQSPINSHSVVDSSTPTKRRSQGGDSKYGFSSPGNGHHPSQQRDPNTPRNYGGQPPNYSYNSPSSRAGQQTSTNLDYINGPHQSRSSGGGYPTSQQQQQQQQHHFSPYSKYGGGSSNGSHGPSSSGVVELPPKIDRSSKPSNRQLARSAQERLFGSREGDINGLDIDTYPTSPPGPAPGQPGQGTSNGGPHQSHDYLSSMRGSSLDRERAAKAGSYDSSSSYESYNRLGLTLTLAGNNHQSGGGDVNAMPGSPTSAGLKSHDPYRYTRSTSQPVRSPTELTSPATKQLHRPFDHKKQSPPPKSAPYKPVPPPKPKNYRPPANASSSTASNSQQPMTPNSNYWNHSPPGTLNHPNRPAGGGGGGGSSSGGGGGGGGGDGSSSVGVNNHHGYYSHGPPSSNTASAIHNGLNSYRYEDDTNGGFDSGHGSSLDRHSYGANSLYGKAPPPPPPVNGSNRNNEAGQYYYNIPPPRENNQKHQQQHQQSRDGGRLDLAQHRDQRGSAFELYKKPADPRSPAHGHQPLYMEHNARLDYEYYDGDGFSSSPYDYYHHYHHDDYYSPPTSPPPPNCSVIATVRGWLTHDHGGRLESVETGVALLVPPRALPPGPAAHLVYFKVCRQDHVRAVDTNGVPLDDGKGEALLSPLVQCGPKGLRFLQPVELRIPHDGGSRANSSGRWNVSLKASNELGQWRQIELPQRGNDDYEQRAQSEQLDDAKNSRNHLSVFVDHF